MTINHKGEIKMFVMMFRKLAVISLALVILFMAACSSPVAEVVETAVPPTEVPSTDVPPTEIPETAVPATDVPPT
jgi:hypothetical protein